MDSLKDDKDVLYDLISNSLFVPMGDFLKALDLLDKSLASNYTDGYVSAEKQALYIKEYLKNIDVAEAICIASAWDNLFRVVVSRTWYRKIFTYDFLTCSSYNDFYANFGSWLTCRGTKFLIDYFKLGDKFVISYMTDNNIPSSEYMYECFRHEFDDYVMLGHKIKYNLV